MAHLLYYNENVLGFAAAKRLRKNYSSRSNMNMSTILFFLYFVLLIYDDMRVGESK